MGYLLISQVLQVPTFKYTLPLKIKDSLLEYHRSKFPLIIDYIHSSKYRVDFCKIQNPCRNRCDVTHNMCIGSRQIQKHARKVSSYNMRGKNLGDIDISTRTFLQHSWRKKTRILASLFYRITPYKTNSPFLCV